MAEPAFLDNLRKSRLLSEKQLAALAPLANGTDPRPLAEALVRREWLTEFQVQQVAAGNGVHLRLGEYILLDLLGEGAMGEVYRASHIRHGIVALKVMRREKLGNPAAVQRFAREINLAAKLIHPHIVRAVECGSAAGHYFLAMEFLPGPDLSRLVKEGGPLPIQAACEYIRQAALALHHAHEQGVIHRDLKPANLMLNATGDVKLLDLGLARRDEGEANLALTRLGQVIGTPDYLAPEQAIDARKADARADIYSLGCTLFYLVAGKPPFSAVSLADLLLKHQTEDARPLRSLRPDAPDWLAQLCGWMMNKRREDRPGSALEVAAKIEELLADHQAAPPPALALSGPNPWAGLDEKKPTKAGGVPLAWVGLLAVLLVGCAAAMMMLPPRKPPDLPPEGKKPEEKKPLDKEKGGPVKPPPDKEKEPDESGPFEFRAHVGGAEILAVSADGKRAATAGKDNKVACWDLVKRVPLWSAGPQVSPVRQLMFDGVRLRGRAGRQMFLWEAMGKLKETTEAKTLLAPRTGVALPLAEDPRAKVRIGEEEVLLAQGGGSGAVDFHPKQDLCLVLDTGGEVLVVGLKPPRREVIKLGVENAVAKRAIWGNSGEQILIGLATGAIEFHETPEATPVTLLPRLEGAVTALALSKDRKKLLAGTDRGVVWLFDLGKNGKPRKNGKQPAKPVGRVEGTVNAVAFTPSGEWGLGACSDGTLRMWKLPGTK